MKEATSYVVWPACTAPNLEAPAGFYDTEEGGMQCWLLVPEQFSAGPRSSVVNVCAAGVTISVLDPSIFVSPFPSHSVIRHVTLIREGSKVCVDLLQVVAAVCIGASRSSPWDCARGAFWQATRRDLTGEGRRLFEAMADLYRTPPLFAMALST